MIELLLATALAAVLMVTVLQVTASLGSVPDTISPRAKTQTLWQMNLRRILEQDLAEALQVQIEDGAIVLEGPLGIDTTSYERTHQPSRVIYRMDAHNGSTAMLLREQQELLSRSNRHRQTMLVCNQVSAFMLEPVIEDTAQKGQLAPAAPASYEFAVAANGITCTQRISLR